MAFLSLPTLIEESFAAYIAANYSGDYKVTRSFSMDDYSLPMIMIKAGRLQEIEPQTNVFEGDLAVSVLTQIDDVADPVSSHDSTLSTVYTLLLQDDILTSVSDPGGAFVVQGLYISAYDQEKMERAFVTSIEFKVFCYALPS